MRIKTISVLFLIVLLTTLLTCCTNYTKTYIDNAKTILNENQLDNEIRIVYEGKYKDRDYYLLIVTSEKFAEISDSQKREILLKLYNIFIPDSNMVFSYPKVNSQGHTYSIGFEGRMERDGDVYPPIPILEFNPPVEVELISLIGNSESKFEYISAGTTIENLYNFDHNGGPYSEMAIELERNGEAAFISTRTKVLLMKIDGGYAYVQLREQSFALRPGVVVIYRENILSYPNMP